VYQATGCEPNSKRTRQVSIKQCERIGWPTLLGLAGVVGLMMVLAPCMTATGTARFMAPMGHDIKVGYGVGITLELAQDVLPVGVLALWTRRARGRALALGAAWHSVWSSAAWQRTPLSQRPSRRSNGQAPGRWKVRTNAKTELASIEQQLAALSRPAPPPAGEDGWRHWRVPACTPAIWKDSQDCAEIQGSASFCEGLLPGGPVASRACSI